LVLGTVTFESHVDVGVRRRARKPDGQNDGLDVNKGVTSWAADISRRTRDIAAGLAELQLP
jgi:hypothetical protein